MDTDAEYLAHLADADEHFELASSLEESEDYERALQECNAAIAIAQPFCLP